MDPNGKKPLSLPLQTRDASFTTLGGDNIMHNKHSIHRTHRNDCQLLLLNSVQSSFDRTTVENQTNIPQHNQRGPRRKQPALPPSKLSPMAARAHMNNLKKIVKQPLVEKQAEETVFVPEISNVGSDYKPGKGAERLAQYMLRQRNMPEDNNIQFWRNLVAEFFAPGATKRWCISLYKNIEQIDNIFKVEWQCNMCNQKPCYGFEMSEELLPRLHKRKYDTGLVEERLQIDTPNEYQGACGQIFLHYPKAVEESQYEQTRTVRNGQLRIVLSPDLKIRSWEFCAQDHEEYVHRNFIVPQVSQLGAAMENYRLSTQESSSATPEERQKHTDLLISSANQMVEALGVPFISQIGVDKRYFRSLQISEVLNIMHGLIDYSQENGIPPKESIAKYPRLGSDVSSSGKKSDQQLERQQSPAAAPSAPYFEPFTGNNVLGNTTTTSNYVGPTNCKRQLSNPYAVTATPAQTTSFTNPLFDLQPRVVAHTALADQNKNVNIESSNNIYGGNSNEVVYIDVENYEFRKTGIEDSSAPEIGTASSSAQMNVDLFPQSAQGNYLLHEYNDEFVDFEGVHELLN